MKTATVSLSETKTPGIQALEIFADNKRVAQGAIKLARAWVAANGGKSKLVTFTESPSQYSNLVLYYRARICFTSVR